MVRRSVWFAGVLVAVVAALAVAGPDARAAGPASAAAPAQPSAAELASARRLFAQAIEAEDHERWSEALEIYERVGRIVVSPSLRYHMGVCYEGLGQLVEAVNAFELAAASAKERREVALAKESLERLAKARARVAQLTLSVPADAEGLRVEIDGQPIHPALVGTAVPVNPGERRVVVRADNYPAVFEATLRAAPGEAAELRADLGARQAPAGAALAPERPLPKRAPALPPPVVEEPSRAPALVAGGAALALAAGAVATGVAAYSARERYLELNGDPAPGSMAERESLRDEGQALAITSTALTGGAVIAGAIATYLFWPSSTPAGRTSARVSPWVGPGGAGLGIGGAL